MRSLDRIRAPGAAPIHGATATATVDLPETAEAADCQDEDWLVGEQALREDQIGSRLSRLLGGGIAGSIRRLRRGDVGADHRAQRHQERQQPDPVGLVRRIEVLV